MRKRKILFLFLFLTSLFVLPLTSCQKEEITYNIYGNSELWVKLNESFGPIGDFEIMFTSTTVLGEVKEHHIYRKDGAYILDSELSLPTVMQDKNGVWDKVYEGIDSADTISIIYKGKTYTTTGFKFPVPRCLEINLKPPTVDGGDIIINDVDIETVNVYVDVN